MRRPVITPFRVALGTFLAILLNFLAKDFWGSVPCDDSKWEVSNAFDERDWKSALQERRNRERYFKVLSSELIGKNSDEVVGKLGQGSEWHDDQKRLRINYRLAKVAATSCGGNLEALMRVELGDDGRVVQVRWRGNS